MARPWFYRMELRQLLTDKCANGRKYYGVKVRLDVVKLPEAVNPPTLGLTKIGALWYRVDAVYSVRATWQYEQTAVTAPTEVL